ncbi:MAG: NAD(P)H-dependent oxidoreductase, partial [Candidatus Heimdallarchaeota archaeon]|nr:NAD(P)H-dependent oxidoreductase [Candidatus Heimdallarchaeota archaeon]
MKVWPYVLNITETKNVEEIYFFDFGDNKDEACALAISQGKCQFIDGKPNKQTVKITVETKDWIAILSKELMIDEAIADGKLVIEGDDQTLEKFERYFSGDPEGKQVKHDNYSITENEKQLQEGKWTKPRKVLGLIGSPRKRGATAFLYSIIKQGLDDSDCEIDTVYLPDLKNKTCKGCFTCWHGKDKKCVHDDDVNELIHKLHEYDLMILAAPVYLDGLPGALKNFFDRTLSILEPEFILKDGHCRHPVRYPKMPHLVLLSPCGYTEIDNFSPMVEHVKAICKNMHLTYLEEILIPATWIMTIPNLQPLYLPIFEAIKQSGKDIIASGKISEKMKKQITKPIFSKGQILAVYNSRL